MQTTLHQYLKESTLPRHQQAEGHPFQGYLANGKLPFASYKAYLQQLFALHERFETSLLRHAEYPALASVVSDEHFQLPFLKQDLDALSLPADEVKALPCVERFCSDDFFAKNPVALLGVLYVLLGSKHGARFIAHNVKEAYSLSSAGSLYFNPYGDQFRALWQQFTASLNNLQLDERERAAVLEGANRTFDLFGEIGSEIWEQQGAGKAAR